MRFVFTLIFPFLFLISVYAQDEDSLRLAELQQELSKASNDTSKVNLLNELVGEYIGLDNELALDYAKKAITLAKKLNFDKGLSEAYYNIGKCFYYEYEFDSVIFYYNLSEAINENESNWHTSANYESLLGLIYHIQSDYSRAINFYKRSLNISSKLNDIEGIAYCYNNIGAAFYNLGNYQKALDNYFESLKIKEDIGDNEMVARTLANIGGIYEEQDKLETALEYYKKAIGIAYSIDAKLVIADTYLNIGGVFTDQNQFDSTISVYQKSLEIFKELDDLRGTIAVYNLFGQAYISTLDKVKGNELYTQALKAKSYLELSLELNNNELDEPEQKIVSYQSLGEVYYYTHQDQKAIKYLNKAIEMAEENDDIENIKTAHQFLSLAYERTGNYKEAYENHVQFKNWSDTLKSDENIELLTQASMQYEFDKQQKEQEFIQAQKELEYKQKQKQDRLIRIFILSVLVIVLGFSVQVFRSYQRKKKDNILLAQQNEEIERQKEEITDSIRYAKRIQSAILPSDEWANENLPEHFILFRPRDIVSGDYYWMNRIDNKVILVAADCTGHGVPGAFMSMLGVSFLNEIVLKNNTIQPNLILNQLRAQVKKTLDQTGKDGEAKDGMDIALCVIDLDTMKMQYSGAYNPLWLYRKGELLETKADKMPIGIYIREKESFTNHEIQLEKGDTFYIFSDGYADQFGGENGMKFKSRTFKTLLANIQDKSMLEQWEILESTIDDWRGDIEQVDDMIVLGVRV